MQPDLTMDALATKFAGLSLKQCHLLELAAELRNRIYEYALVEDDDVEIRPETFAQPGLLLTCRKIRAEALPIYFLDNVFKFNIRKFEASLLVAFCGQAIGKSCESWWIEDPTEMFSIVVDEDAEMENALAWLKADQDDKAPRFRCTVANCDGEGEKVCCAVSEAFDIAGMFASQELDWIVVKAVLIKFLKSMQRQNGTVWLWN